MNLCYGNTLQAKHNKQNEKKEWTDNFDHVIMKNFWSSKITTKKTKVHTVRNDSYTTKRVSIQNI